MVRREGTSTQTPQPDPPIILSPFVSHLCSTSILPIRTVFSFRRPLLSDFLARMSDFQERERSTPSVRERDQPQVSPRRLSRRRRCLVTVSYQRSSRLLHVRCPSGTSNLSDSQVITLHARLDVCVSPKNSAEKRAFVMPETPCLPLDPSLPSPPRPRSSTLDSTHVDPFVRILP